MRHPERSKASHRKSDRKYRAKHRAKDIVHSKAWRLANQEQSNTSKRKWLLLNPEKRKASVRKWSQANPANIQARGALRRAQKLNAIPIWLTKEQKKDMVETYKLAIANHLHVDHIIPLVSDLVCGLHVPWNLQLLSPRENLVKGNRLEGKML